jgi:hypothetical protein
LGRTFELGAESRHTVLAAKIVFNNKNSVFDCVVTELSAAGARIKVVSPLGIPRRFHLELIDLGTRYLCDLKARDLTEIIVAFVDVPALAPRTDSQSVA